MPLSAVLSKLCPMPENIVLTAIDLSQRVPMPHAMTSLHDRRLAFRMRHRASRRRNSRRRIRRPRTMPVMPNASAIAPNTPFLITAPTVS